MTGGQIPWHFMPCGSVLNGSTALRLAWQRCSDWIFIDLPRNFWFWGLPSLWYLLWKDPPFFMGKSTINGHFQWLC